MEFEVRNEGGKPDVFGNIIPAYTVIGVYDDVAGTRNTYYNFNYQALVNAVGETLAQQWATNVGWTIT